jgi:hypothetical protein
MRHGKKSVAERVGQPTSKHSLQSTNLAGRTWRSSCNTFEHHQFPRLTQRDRCSLAHRRRHTSLSTLYSTLLSLSTQSPL